MCILVYDLPADDDDLPGETYGHHPALEFGKIDRIIEDHNCHVLVEGGFVVLGVGFGFSFDPDGNQLASISQSSFI